MSSPAPEKRAVGDADEMLIDAMNRVPLKCPFCEYDLRSAVNVTCPECGRVLTWKDFQDDRQMPGGKFVVLSLMGACLWCVVTLFALPVIVLSMGMPLALRGLLSLADLVLLALSITVLISWAHRPRRLLTYTGGELLLVRLLAVPMGVLTCVVGVALPVLFVWAVVEYWRWR